MDESLIQSQITRRRKPTNTVLYFLRKGTNKDLTVGVAHYIVDLHRGLLSGTCLIDAYACCALWH